MHLWQAAEGVSIAEANDNDTRDVDLLGDVFAANLGGYKGALLTLREDDGCMIALGEDFLIMVIDDVECEARYFLVLFGGVVIAEDLYLLARLENAQHRRDHVNLLIHLDLLRGFFIVKEVLLFLLERVTNADLILQLMAHISLLDRVDGVLLDGDEVLDELLLGVALDMLDAGHFHLEQIRLLVLVVFTVSDEKVHEDLKDVWLQERDDGEGALWL